MLKKIETLLTSSRTSPISWLTGLSGILMVRFFLEAVSSPTVSGIIASDASTLIHYYLFFICAAFILMIFFWFALPEWRKYLPQFTLFAFLITLLPPIIDFLWSGGTGFKMAYLFNTAGEMLNSFITFFGPDWRQGITLGMRIEFALILLLAGFLIYKKRNLLRSTISVIILYIVIFTLVSLPGFIASGSESPLSFVLESAASASTAANNLHTSFFYSSVSRALEVGFNFLMAKILFIISLALLSVWFYLSDKKKLLAVIKNSRPERVLSYFISILFGMFLAWVSSPPANFNWVDYLSVIVLFISFYLSWSFAVATNDIADKEIDTVSNPDRPLETGNLSEKDMRQAAFIFLISSLVGGYLSGFYAFFALLAFTALYYTYSMPPTRFKRIPFFATFLIGLCNLAAAVAGFFLVSNTKMLAAFPAAAIVGITVFFSLLPNIRDLKDMRGDAKEGILTVPVLFGPKWGPGAVGIMAALAYLLVPIFSKIYWLYLFAIPAALLSYFLSIRKNYKESPLFLVYFAFVILSAALLIPLLF